MDKRIVGPSRPAKPARNEDRQTCTAVCPPMWKFGSCGVAHHCELPQGHAGRHKWPCQNLDEPT